MENRIVSNAEELHNLIFSKLCVKRVNSQVSAETELFSGDAIDNNCLICGVTCPLRKVSKEENKLLGVANLELKDEEKWVCRLCSKVLVKWKEMWETANKLLSEIDDLIQCVKFTRGRRKERPSCQHVREHEDFCSCTCEDYKVKESPFSELELTDVDEEDNEIECVYWGPKVAFSTNEEIRESVGENGRGSSEMSIVNNNETELTMAPEVMETINEEETILETRETNASITNDAPKYRIVTNNIVETVEKVKVILDSVIHSHNPEADLDDAIVPDDLFETMEKVEVLQGTECGNSRENEIPAGESNSDLRPKRKSRIQAEEKLLSLIRNETVAKNREDEEETFIDSERNSTTDENSSEQDDCTTDEDALDVTDNDTRIGAVKRTVKQRKTAKQIIRSELTEKRIRLRDLRRKESNCKCEECGKTFTSVSGLYFHHKQKHEYLNENEDDEGRAHCCLICPKKFCHKSTLEIHIRLMHREGWDGKHVCRNCKKTFEAHDELMNHKLHECSEILPKCGECGNKFKMRSHLYTHHKLRHENGTIGNFYCKDCNKSFKSADGLTVHNKLFHEARKTNDESQCRNCGRKYLKKEDLFTHQISCKSQICELCDCEVRKQNFSGHFASHMHRIALQFKRVASNGDITFKCPACNDSFETVRQLRTHFGQDHKEGPVNCIPCDKELESFVAFKKHIQSRWHKANELFTLKLNANEVKERVFPCGKCSSIFSNSEDLENHKKEHLVDYICEECGLIFTSKPGLGQHKRDKHPKDYNKPTKPKRSKILQRNHCCQQCPKKFVNKTSLRNHLRLIHWGMKYACDRCNTSFKSRTFLTNHKHICDQLQQGIVIPKKPKKKYYVGVKENCRFCGKSMAKLCINRHVELEHYTTKWEGRKCPYKCGSELTEEGWQSHVETCAKTNATERSSYRCTHCSDTFLCPLLKISHVLNQHKDNNHKCQHCPLVCSTSDILFYHIRSHKELREYLCQKCGKSFRTHFSLHLHKEAVCNDDEEARQAFLAKRREENRRSIEKKKPFKCPECGKGFVEERRMKAHLTNAHKESDDNDEEDLP